MLEFNNWFFVLVANFLILFFVLRAIFFKPIANVFKERESAINGALDDAKKMVASKDEAVARMNAELLSAKNKAKEISNIQKEEGLVKQKEMLSNAEAKAVEMIEKAKQELRAETENARTALRADVEKFSEDIVNKLVKV
jgi:F-type H+-transporting ATPase subunit b